MNNHIELQHQGQVESNSVKEDKPFPAHLNPVQEKHLKDLFGLKMKCNSNPGGECLNSCTTMHLSNTKDSHGRRRVNRRINHHIADIARLQIKPIENH